MGIDVPTDLSMEMEAEPKTSGKMEEAASMAWKAEGLDKALLEKGNAQGAQMAKMATMAIFSEGMQADMGGEPNMELVEKSAHTLSVLCDENEYDSGKR